MITGKVLQQRLKPKVLVENKLSFAATDSELSIYDTFEPAARVKLSSDQVLFCGMVTGKKVMHAADENYHKDFLPHESFVIAPNQGIEIDFPEAKHNAPTTCLAIEISTDRIAQVSQQMNRHLPIADEFEQWHYAEQLVHTHHNHATQALLSRMVDIYTENHPDRNLMIDMAVNELLVRLLRHQKCQLMLKFCSANPDHNGFNAALHYLIANFNEPSDIDMLCKISCMSRTKFFECFKMHVGCTPQAFQQNVRLKQAAKMIEQGHQITATCFDVGFKNTSHFSRAFKQCFGLSPHQYKARHANAIAH